ncbi:unnamed protein product, partial [Staurois parvus]
MLLVPSIGFFIGFFLCAARTRGLHELQCPSFPNVQSAPVCSTYWSIMEDLPVIMSPPALQCH